MLVSKELFYNSKEKLFLFILFFAALVSLFFFINFRTFAFPEHNIDFKISRDQAGEKSQAFVKQLGIDPASYQQTTVFSIDTTSKTYLEREVGVTQTAKLAENEVDIWHYTTRFFKPLEKEQFIVTHLPNGRFSGFYKEIEDAAAGADLPPERAKVVAERFLANSVKQDVSRWTLIDQEQIKRPKRVDHTFTWEKNGFRSGEATYRMEVYVYGDGVGGYVESLKIPESWIRAYETETSNNDLAQTVAEALMVLVFGLPILLTFIIQYRRNNLRLASLRSFGIATALISLLAALNSIPLILAEYDTTVSWEGFIGSVIVLSFLGAFFEGASLMLVLAAGEAKFREMYPKLLSLEASFKRAILSKEVNKALFIGVFAGIIFFTYELMYYFLGRQIGFWAPADINYADMFSTYLPWIYPLFIGFMAAATEEGMFRLFGIPFLKKHLKSTWLAVLITSVIWAFLHSNYPQSPWFVRGIEVGIMGIALGWLFVRYGFWASFSAHFTFNALQTAIYFFASGSLYASISSTIASLLPFIIALVLLIISIRRKGFTQVKESSLNSSLAGEDEPVVQTEKVASRKYAPLPNAGRQYLIAFSMLSLFMIWVLYPKTSLEQVPTSIDRTEVIKKADETMQKQGIATGEFMRVVRFVPEDISLEEKYILEEKDYAALTQVYPKKLPLAHWEVRYFKALEKNEYYVDILPDGRLKQVVFVLDEKASGASLTIEEAQKTAEAYLSSEKAYKLTNFTLVEKKTQQKDNRADHTLVYEEKGTKIGEAAFRTEVTIKGDRVSGYEQFLKLPESWILEQTKTTTLDFVVGGIVALFGLMVLWFGFRAFFDFVRGKELHFRRAIVFAIVVTLASVIATINSWPVFFAGYETTIPLVSFSVQAVLTIIMGLIVTFFVFMLLFATFVATWKQFNGYVLPKEGNLRVEYLRDALIAGYSVPLIISGLSSVLVAILIENNLLNSITKFDFFPKLDTLSPAISALSDLPIAIGGMFFLAISLLLLRKYFKSWFRVLVSLSCIAVLLAIPQHQMTEDIASAIMQNLLLLYGVFLVIVLILRRNLLAYGLLLYNSLLLSNGWVLFEQNNLFFKINGMVLLLFLLVPFGVYLWYSQKQTST